MIIIPQQDIKLGATVEFEGVKYVAEVYVSQGKELKGADYTHIMFDAKGAYAMRVA